MPSKVVFDISDLEFSELLIELADSRPVDELLEALELQQGELNTLINQIPKLRRLREKVLYYCLKNKLIELVVAHGGVTPSYNILDKFDFTNEPIGYNQKLPQTVLFNRPTDIAGFPVTFPIGLAASVITGTSKWVKFYAERGFDILTYKTVRTRQVREHKYPNWVFIPTPTEIKSRKDFDKEQAADPNYWPEHPQELTMANSFGVPSLSPTEWQSDVRVAKASLRDGQVLIVSVMASTRDSLSSIADDYAEAALLAKKAGADIIELNLSCPNIPDDPIGEIYHSAKTASLVTTTVRNILKDNGYDNVPVFIKIGYLEYADLLNLIEATSNAINGVVAINTISVPIVDDDNNVFFPNDEEKGIKRHNAGLSGAAIRELAKEVVRNLVAIRAQKKLNLNILAAGGVFTARDFEEYLNLGVDGVLSVTGAMLNPNMAIEIRHEHRLANTPVSITIIGEKAESDTEVSMYKKNKNNDLDRLKKLEDGVYVYEGGSESSSDEFIETIVSEGLDDDLFELIRLTRDIRSGKITITQARESARKYYQTAH